jgi:hypothetical protein
MEEIYSGDLENDMKLYEIKKSITKSLLYNDTNNANIVYNCMCSFKLSLIIAAIIFSTFLITFILFKKN